MKILYIDERDYGHNKDIHVDFISSFQKEHKIYAYGNYMDKYFKNNFKEKEDLDKICSRINPDIILTYNCNGSSYEIQMDNLNRYKWIEDFLSKIDIPKFHVTTDYCRSGFKTEQADWFKDLNYTAAFFRHKISLEYPLEVPKFWMPFSVDKKLYEINSLKDVSSKSFAVGFLGAAHNSSKSLYANRIAAIDFFKKQKLLKTSKVLNKEKFLREILVGSKYVKFLTSNMFNITCGGSCNYLTAKYFQIPASYSLMLATETNGLEIFPKESYILYSENPDDLNRAKTEMYYLLKRESLLKERMELSYNYVIKNHNHKVRMNEFINIVKGFL